MCPPLEGKSLEDSRRPAQATVPGEVAATFLSKGRLLSSDMGKQTFSAGKRGSE